ncbi:hypothetical protein GYMLUDRAFT_148494 [Collybiopsis luxurians FD-317 M1]|nr:hypothetical protein GYMLUDRAFT_148494 [Collybiopsis luxurians FD-317 M1]
MSPLIFRDPDITQKLLEAIIDTPGGKRTVSRLARTCRTMSEPALDLLWKELDSLLPLIGLFPPNLLKRVRKPGLGLSKAPAEEDWEKVMKYGERVRSIAYSEAVNNVSPTIFPMLAQNRPREYILPNLQQLIWKVETATALDHCTMFLSPTIESLQLELGPTRFPSLNKILGDVCSRMKLTNFSIISSVSLPDTFTVMLSSQKALRKVALVAPGALGSGVGRWIAYLPELKSLQLDLSSRTLTAVEGFFDELPSHSGDSTPSSVATTDSGVFSGDEPDFSSIRKSTMRLPGNLESKAGFTGLRHLHLTGEVVNIAAFLRHFSIPLIQLDLVIEDPPDNAEWMELAYVISDSFSSSLQTLRISATATSKFNELVRSTSRGEPTVSRLALEHLQPLPALRRLEIDLPESINFLPDDIIALASACPNVEEIKLCPLARFPVPPKLTLEALAPLTEHCEKLHTLSIPINARRGSPSVLSSQASSSSALRRLHVGHSWINDSLHVSILLSHLAPSLDTLKWFHDKNRAGFIESNARGWEKVSEILPHLQNIRLTERKAASISLPSETTEPTPPPPARVETAEKAIMAMVPLVHQGVLAKPQTKNSVAQTWGPKMVNESVDVHPELASVSIDAAPRVVVLDKSVDAIPETTSIVVDATPSSVSQAVETMLANERNSVFRPFSSYPMLLPVFSLISFTCRFLFEYPMSVPLRMLHVIFDHIPTLRRSPTTPHEDISMSALQVRQS